MTAMRVTQAVVRFGRQLSNEDKLKVGNALGEPCFGADISFQDVPLYTYKVEHDRNNEGPRRENENLGVMHCGHKRYTLGDGDKVDTPFVDNDTSERIVNDDVILSWPIYLYDHGGLTVAHSGFGCQFDSGLLGWHYMLRTVAEANWPSLTGDELLAAVEHCLVAELEDYDQYLRGNVYGFQIFDADGDEYEACWGFLGDNIETNGMLDNAGTEHHAGLRAAWEKRDE